VTITYTPAGFGNGALTAVNATLYTVPGSTNVILKELVLTNADSSARTITMYLVPNGGTAGQSNEILAAQKLDGNSTLVLALSTYLETGATIQGLADKANLVSWRASGVTLT
jgi:hypothetical protein